MIPDQTPKEFCKVVTQFTGEEISNAKQIKEWRMTGTELYEFCNFYFSCVYTRLSLQKLQEQDNTIFRLNCIIVVLVIIIFILIINK